MIIIVCAVPSRGMEFQAILEILALLALELQIIDGFSPWSMVQIGCSSY